MLLKRSWFRVSDDCGVTQPLSESRLTKLRQMTVEVWLAEGLDALTLAYCLPLSPKTNRLLHHPAQQLPSADTSHCANRPSASGTMRATILSPHCLNKMQARQMFVFKKQSPRLLRRLFTPSTCANLLLFLNCSLLRRLFQVELLHII